MGSRFIESRARQVFRVKHKVCGALEVYLATFAQFLDLFSPERKPEIMGVNGTVEEQDSPFRVIAFDHRLTAWEL